MSQPVLSTSSAILIALIVPLAIILSSVVLSVFCHVCRRTIGKAVAMVGVIEMMGFIMFFLSMPFEARVIIFLQGFITVFSGLAVFVSAKPVNANNNEKIV